MSAPAVAAAASGSTYLSTDLVPDPRSVLAGNSSTGAAGGAALVASPSADGADSKGPLPSAKDLQAKRLDLGAIRDANPVAYQAIMNFRRALMAFPESGTSEDLADMLGNLYEVPGKSDGFILLLNALGESIENPKRDMKTFEALKSKFFEVTPIVSKKKKAHFGTLKGTKTLSQLAFARMQAASSFMERLDSWENEMTTDSPSDFNSKIAELEHALNNIGEILPDQKSKVALLMRRLEGLKNSEIAVLKFQLKAVIKSVQDLMLPILPKGDASKGLSAAGDVKDSEARHQTSIDYLNEAIAVLADETKSATVDASVCSLIIEMMHDMDSTLEAITTQLSIDLQSGDKLQMVKTELPSILQSLLRKKMTSGSSVQPTGFTPSAAGSGRTSTPTVALEGGAKLNTRGSVCCSPVVVGLVSLSVLVAAIAAIRFRNELVAMIPLKFFRV